MEPVLSTALRGEVRKDRNTIPFLILVTSFLGILDTAYLSAERFLGGTVKCVLVSGCDEVTGSAYSTVAGWPVALLGLIFYLLIFFAAYLSYERRGWVFKRALFIFSVVGFIASAWFLYVQAYILEAYCTYCLVSTLTSTLILIFSVFFLRKKDNL
jgi:uncharacterized membrane protein